MPTETGPASVTRANAGMVPAGGTSSSSGIASASGVAATMYANKRQASM